MINNILMILLNIKMKNNIVLNDLFDYDYKIYQNEDYFKFSIDSILLAEIVKKKKNKNKLLDMCSGNCAVPMILHKKYNDLDITAIELQEEVYDLGKKSLEVNNIEDIRFINDDVKNITKYTDNIKFDYITCNPPYFQTNPDININENKVKAIARHELTITLEDIIKIASKNIEYNGSFYIVHKDFRLADIIVLLNKYNFGVKKLVPIYNDENSECTSILVESIYNGKNYVKITKPVFINKYKSYKNIF